MTKYDSLDVKVSNSEFNKLKSGIKNETRVILNLSSNVVGDSNYKTNLPHKLLLPNTQISKLCKPFTNGLSANIKLTNTDKICLHLGRFLPFGFHVY